MILRNAVERLRICRVSDSVEDKNLNFYGCESISFLLYFLHIRKGSEVSLMLKNCQTEDTLDTVRRLALLRFRDTEAFFIYCVRLSKFIILPDDFVKCRVSNQNKTNKRTMANTAQLKNYR
jgi:hypothetical protein